MTALHTGVPDELRKLPRWLTWRAVPDTDGGKPRKVPVSVDGTRAGSSTDATTWGSHAAAVETLERGGVTGVGLALGQGFMGIDLDGVRDPMTGELLPWAADAVAMWTRAGAWVEVSHSGTGVHAVLLGQGDKAWRKQAAHPDGGSVECYWEGRYFVVTGEALHLPERLPTMQPMSELHTWLGEMLQRDERPAQPMTTPRSVAASSAPRDRKYGLAALEQECAALAVAPEGGRNTQLNSAAFAVGQLVAGGALDELEAVQRLTEAARACGLGDAEISGTLRSGWEAGQREPRTAPEPEQQWVMVNGRKVLHTPTRTQADAAAPAPAPVMTAEQRSSDVLERIRSAQAENAATQGWQHRGIVVPQYPALTDALDGISGWCLMTGGTGVGKTTVTLAAALSVAMRAKLAQVGGDHAGGAAPDAELTQWDGTGTCPDADVVYLSTEMTWAEQYHAMVCMLSGTWWRDYSTRRATLPQQKRDALDRAERTLEQLMTRGRLHLLSSADVQWHWSDGWHHALQGVQDCVEQRTHGRRTLLMVDTLATLPVLPAVTDVRGIDSFQRDELVVDGCTELRRWLEGTHSAMLTVTEEAKHLTGSADMHSARGSAAYTYRASQRLALTQATAERTGTRSMGVLPHAPANDCSEVDMHILKARQGGHGGAVVPMVHAYTRGRVNELKPSEMVWGGAPQGYAYWTASQLSAARRSPAAHENRKQQRDELEVEGSTQPRWLRAKRRNPAAPANRKQQRGDA